MGNSPLQWKTGGVRTVYAPGRSWDASARKGSSQGMAVPKQWLFLFYSILFFPLHWICWDGIGSQNYGGFRCMFLQHTTCTVSSTPHAKSWPITIPSPLTVLLLPPPPHPAHSHHTVAHVCEFFSLFFLFLLNPSPPTQSSPQLPSIAVSPLAIYEAVSLLFVSSCFLTLSNPGPPLYKYLILMLINLK